MYIKMKITNIKAINSFEFNIPLGQGLYALTGENACGKSTVIACASRTFYEAVPYSYFGIPMENAKIEFEYNGKQRILGSSNGRWLNAEGNLGIVGFYEGSLIYGNRFKDVEFSRLRLLSSIKETDLLPASTFITENLGSILHDDKSYYSKMFVMKPEVKIQKKLLKQPYYYKSNGKLVNQLEMSTGENLLISILHSLEMKILKERYLDTPSLMLLDEIELALHSSALRRLIYFLQELSKENNLSILFSTHSIELIRSISAQNIFYLQKFADGSLKVINPCYPVYATRNLESSNYGHDFIIMVEDDLAKSIIEKILREKRLLGNKRVLVIPVGGWTEVLRFAYDTIRSNLVLKTTKIIIILDRDIESHVNGFLKRNKMSFTNKPNYLPIKSLEKYLLEKLTVNIDSVLLQELNDYIFQNKSLSEIINKYLSNVKNGIYTDQDKIKNGKMLFEDLQNELRQVRKTPESISELVVEHLFKMNNEQINELSVFLSTVLEPKNP